MRAFIAMELSPQVKESLRKLINDLKSRNIKGRWVPPENIHLTLRFLGNIEEDQVKAIEQLLEEVAEEADPFQISIEGLGAFPHPARPRVLWVGVKEGTTTLQRLYQIIEKGLVRLGFPPNDKSFKPHLTLARFKNPLERTRRLVYQTCKEFQEKEWDRMEATSVILFESILSPQGAQYRKVKEVLLRKADS
ncbi:MAG TPA: RNA 2',3'-cyclic phosphodiesterase [Thermosulfidibacter takaii]|uniref:RNA 2',3'-cyclic phosphodiesterase n=1 Tax=Thermosulfidibacter takaii TaxID=412593 RepID=A0A7C0Y9G8_9BACT|nr:RNA 2',3'-cyclic phosphodiesterase [Thermosulfidibacter takaii]